MIVVHGDPGGGSEQAAAQALALLAASDPHVEASRDVHLEIFPSIQCFGQRVRDQIPSLFVPQFIPRIENDTHAPI